MSADGETSTGQARRPPRLVRIWRAPVTAIGRLPLRVQLVAAMVVLLAAALLGTSVAMTVEMKHYLIQQLDHRLNTTLESAMREQASFLSGQQSWRPPDNVVVQVTFNGKPLPSSDPLSGLGRGGSERQPAIPPNPQIGSPFTVGSQGGAGTQWRVEARSSPVSGVLVVAATREGSVDHAVNDLGRTFLLIAFGALILMGALGYGLVRGSLRPLEEVEQTTQAIAGGDLSRRVPVRRQGSEVGRLAQAFNTMIGRIETAFRDTERSEAAARGSEERMRRFVADASHELRTPLTSIRGYAELYRQGAVSNPDEVANVLHRIEDQASRMGLLVEDLLLLARLDHQRPLERAPVDLAVLAVDAVHDAHAIAPDRPVRLRLPPHRGEEPVAIRVLGDAARLRQVIGNLVNNALTHTPPKTPVEVRVRTDALEAVIEVADAGPGLSREQAERVFERFYRADPARGRQSGGTGLGLAIVAALVTAHGGRVEVDTALDIGTTFRILLPIKR